MSKEKSKKVKKSKSAGTSDATPTTTAAVATDSPKAGKPSKDEKAAAKAAKKAAEHAAAEAERAAKAEAKASRKASRKGSKEAEKSAQKADKKAAKKAAKKADASAMPKFKHLRAKRLSSGRGPSPREIGESLVALFNAGKATEAESTWYARKIESIESEGQVFEGLAGVAEKSAWWNANFTIVSMRAAELYTCATGFTVVYKGRVKGPDGVERDANEVGVYTVEKGRIVREQFMG